MDISDKKHALHCRLVGCQHPPVYPGIGQGWCQLCRMAAFNPTALVDEPSFGHWLAGLADGEGCFWVHREKAGAYYAPQFKIKLRADDRAVLRFCRDVLAIGNLYDHPATDANGRKAKPTASWVVQSTADVDALRSFFERYPLRAKKARDFEVWCRAIDVARSLPRGNRWHGPRDWSPLLAVKDELENVRRYK